MRVCFRTPNFSMKNLSLLAKHNQCTRQVMRKDSEMWIMPPARERPKKNQPSPSPNFTGILWERRELQIDLCETTARIAIVHFASCAAVLLYHQDVAKRRRSHIIVRTSLPQGGTVTEVTGPYHLRTDTWLKYVKNLIKAQFITVDRCWSLLFVTVSPEDLWRVPIVKKTRHQFDAMLFRPRSKAELKWHNQTHPPTPA